MTLSFYFSGCSSWLWAEKRAGGNREEKRGFSQDIFFCRSKEQVQCDRSETVAWGRHFMHTNTIWIELLSSTFLAEPSSLWGLESWELQPDKQIKEWRSKKSFKSSVRKQVANKNLAFFQFLSRIAAKCPHAAEQFVANSLTLEGTKKSAKTCFLDGRTGSKTKKPLLLKRKFWFRTKIQAVFFLANTLPCF